MFTLRCGQFKQLLRLHLPFTIVSLKYDPKEENRLKGHQAYQSSWSCSRSRLACHSRSRTIAANQPASYRVSESMMHQSQHPTQPLPTTVRWIPDAEVSVCYGCQLLFDWVRRKHHCRCVLLPLLCIVAY